jgi:hypothetical protein
VPLISAMASPVLKNKHPLPYSDEPVAVSTSPLIPQPLPLTMLTSPPLVAV